MMVIKLVITLWTLIFQSIPVLSCASEKCMDGEFITKDSGCSTKNEIAIDENEKEEGDLPYPEKVYHSWSFLDIDTHFYQNWTFIDIREHFDCGYELPIIPQSAWRKARNTFASQSSSPSKGRLSDFEDNGFSVPIVARKVPGKGRGIFALRDIKKGDLVWNPKQTARFTIGAAFRDFIFSLDESFVCNALNFSYVQRVENSGSKNKKDHEEEGQLVILIDLDEGGLCNCKDDTEDENLGCRDGMADGYDGGCQMNYLALRDIKAGEELICDYANFQEGPSSWQHFGL